MFKFSIIQLFFVLQLAILWFFFNNSVILILGVLMPLSIGLKL